MRVVIVDDSPSMVRLLKIYFERRGFEVVGMAYSAEEALEIFEHTNFDVLVVDYMLPDGDGCSLAKKLLEKRCFFTIIITSDSELECEDFTIIHKPIKWELLEKALKEAKEFRNQLRQSEEKLIYTS